MEINIIQNTDALSGLKNLSDNCIDSIVTSPPYYQLRDYGSDKQIGLEETMQEYIDNLATIFLECKRVLKDSGTLFIVIGDTYNGDKRQITDRKHSKDLINQSTNIEKKMQKLPRKSLLNIPARLSIALQDMGWTLRNEIIWHKPNAMPSSVKDRFTIDFEKVFFFTKSRHYYFKQAKEEMLTKSQYMAGKGVSIVNSYNRLMNPRGSKGTLGKLNSGLRKQDIVGRADYKGFNARYNAPEDFMRNKRTVWSIATEANKENHFATYPEKLVEILIECGCPHGGVVLDPFMGSGTTAVVAKNSECKYLGFEINSDYIEIANQKIEKRTK